jgi:hypothetical protein
MRGTEHVARKRERRGAYMVLRDHGVDGWIILKRIFMK